MAEAEEKLRAEAGVGAEVEAEAGADAEAKAEERAEAEVEAGAEAEEKTEAEVETGAEGEEKTEAEVEAGAEAEEKTEAEVETGAEGEEKTEAEVETGAEGEEKTEAEAKAGAEAEEKTEAEVETGAEGEERAEAEAKAGAEAEEKTEAEVETGAEAEEKTEAEVKAGAEVEAEAGADAEERAEAEAEAETEAARVDVEEKAATMDDVDGGKEPAVGEVSETIQKMTRSAAVLPGESGHISLAMCAQDIMQKDVVWGRGDDSVQQALTKMQQTDAGYMMVGAEGVLEGLVSKSDIAGAVSVYLRPIFAKWRRPLDDATLNIKVKWIMTRPVCTIKLNTSLAAIIDNNICQFGQCALPVMDEQGKVQGLVTGFDIFQALLSGKALRPEVGAS